MDLTGLKSWQGSVPHEGFICWRFLASRSCLTCLVHGSFPLSLKPARSGRALATLGVFLFLLFIFLPHFQETNDYIAFIQVIQDNPPILKLAD